MVLNLVLLEDMEPAYHLLGKGLEFQLEDMVVGLALPADRVGHLEGNLVLRTVHHLENSQTGYLVDLDPVGNLGLGDTPDLGPVDILVLGAAVHHEPLGKDLDLEGLVVLLGMVPDLAPGGLVHQGKNPDLAPGAHQLLVEYCWLWAHPVSEV
jgi:hypothetical protein